MLWPVPQLPSEKWGLCHILCQIQSLPFLLCSFPDGTAQLHPGRKRAAPPGRAWETIEDLTSCVHPPAVFGATRCEEPLQGKGEQAGGGAAGPGPAPHSGSSWDEAFLHSESPVEGQCRPYSWLPMPPCPEPLQHMLRGKMPVDTRPQGHLRPRAENTDLGLEPGVRPEGQEAGFTV